MGSILLLGAYGQNNLGDEALLEVFLQKFGRENVIVNSAQPDLTAQKYNIKTIPTYLSWPRLRRVRAILTADILVLGGGSVIKEVEGSFLAQLAYLLRLIILLAAARLLQKPVFMLGIGVGPLEQPFFRPLARLVANLATEIYVRDSVSATLLACLGVKPPVRVSTDPVFLLEKSNLEINLPNISPETPLLVVIPRYSLSTAQQKALANACDYAISNFGATVLFVPFQTGYLAKYDDVTAIHAVYNYMTYQKAVRFLIPVTAAEALAIIGRADLVISARLHGLIFATTQHIPTIALDYDIKVSSFMAQIGRTWATLNLPNLEKGYLTNLLEQAWRQRRRDSLSLSDTCENLQVLAMTNFAWLCRSNLKSTFSNFPRE